MKHLEARAALLRVKECDLRMDCLLQCDTSLDRGLHVGGAFSSLTAMTALYYSGLAAFNVTCPTDTEQDLFVLSKGHAVAALAAVYADLGYISRSGRNRPAWAWNLDLLRLCHAADGVGPRQCLLHGRRR